MSQSVSLKRDLEFYGPRNFIPLISTLPFLLLSALPQSIFFIFCMFGRCADAEVLFKTQDKGGS